MEWMLSRRFRCSVTLGLGVVALLWMGGCASTHQPVQTTGQPQSQAIRAGIAPIFPPLAFKQAGEITGIEPQFARLLGPALGTQVTVVETPWEDLIPALRDRRIDIIMSGMSITAQRKQLVSFAHPYLRVGQMMLLRRADAKRLHDNAAINHRSTRVGFVIGTTGEAYVREHLAKAQPLGFDSVDAGVAALRAGKIDVFVHDAPTVYRFAGNGLVGRFEPLTEEYLAWAVRQDDADLRARLNAVLAKWNADGTLENVLHKWIKTTRKPRAAQ